MDKKKIIYSILKEVDAGNRPNQDNYELTKEQFGELIDVMVQDGLLRNASVQRGGQGNKVLVVFLNGAQVTMKGLNYLEENSLLARTYKGLKEIRDWLKP